MPDYTANTLAAYTPVVGRAGEKLALAGITLGDGTGAMMVSASAASAGGAAANPSYVRVEDGTTTALAAVNAFGGLNVNLIDSVGTTPSRVLGLGAVDGNSGGIAVLLTGSYGFAYNGTTWDRIRSSAVGTSIAAAAPGVLGVQGITGGVALSVAVTASGQGASTALPTIVGAVGTSLAGVIPTTAKGVQISIPPGATIAYYIASAVAASAAAAVLVSVSWQNATTATAPIVVQENLTSAMQVWVTNAVAGAGSTYFTGAVTYRVI
ncbi:MAG: hypothetical protein NVSMB5_20070 [Candidatus Velthaea sp.]